MVKKNNGWFSSDRTDRVVVALSLVGLLLTGLILTSENIYQRLFGQSDVAVNTLVVGQLSRQQNDVRYKSSSSMTWQKFKSDKAIHLGDSVFTGDKSFSQVTLDDGSRVDLDQNSLVKFSKLNNIEIPNLALGNFRVAVQGKMKVAINGSVTEIEGNGSEVQFVVKDHQKPKLRLLKGAAKIKDHNTKVALVQNTVVDVPESHEKVDEPETPVRKLASSPQAKSEPVIVEPIKIVARPIAPTAIYTEGLYDLFEMHNGRLTHREHRPALLDFAINVSWAAPSVASIVYAELSQTADFKNTPSDFSAPPGETQGTFKKVFLGSNYYRLSSDGKMWSPTEHFEVVSQPREGTPAIRLLSSKFYLLGNSVDVTAQIEGDFARYVLETSDSPNFEESKTRISWLHDKNIHFQTSSVSTYFLRVRGVDEKQRITAESAPVRIDVERPEWPQAPQLVENQFRVFENENIKLNWQTGKSATHYAIEILNDKGVAIAHREIDEQELSFTPHRAGDYKIKVSSLDRFARRSHDFAEAKIDVLKKPMPLLIETASQERKPAAAEPVASETLKLTLPDKSDLKRTSEISVEGGAFTMYSQTQVSQNQSNPSALLMGVRWLGYKGANGLEASVHAKVADLSQTPGDHVAPVEIQALYHYRFDLPFNPFLNGQTSQWSLIGGYEAYRNSAQGDFSPSYNLIKAGFDVEFPFWRKWVTGGNLLYGYGLDSSHMYEISGFMHYYWQRQLSLGAGYRVNLFSSGSSSTAPSGALPGYREGYGEGYSVLTWHY